MFQSVHFKRVSSYPITVRTDNTVYTSQATAWWSSAVTLDYILILCRGFVMFHYTCTHIYNLSVILLNVNLFVFLAAVVSMRPARTKRCKKSYPISRLIFDTFLTQNFPRIVYTTEHVATYASSAIILFAMV